MVSRTVGLGTIMKMMRMTGGHACCAGPQTRMKMMTVTGVVVGGGDGVGPAMSSHA